MRGVYPRPARFCTIPGCGGKHEGNGLCSKHWHRAWRRKNPEKRAAIKSRYWLKHKDKLVMMQRVRRRSRGIPSRPMVKYFNEFNTGKPNEQP